MDWSRAYQQQGDAGLEDRRITNQGGKPVPDWKRQKVLAIKETDPGYGPSQIRNQLRHEGTTISVESIRQMEFTSIADARDQIRDWVWCYNYYRVHQGLDGLCVPADRFHGWLEAV